MLKQHLQSFVNEPQADYLDRNKVAADVLLAIVGRTDMEPEKAATKARDYADALLKALGS